MNFVFMKDKAQYFLNIIYKNLQKLYNANNSF